MAPIPNPIQLYIYNLLGSGKITIEQICVLCELKGKTLKTNLERPTVSIMVRGALEERTVNVGHPNEKKKGIIPPATMDKYTVWYEKVWLKGKKHARKTPPRHKDQLEQPDPGIQSPEPETLTE